MRTTAVWFAIYYTLTSGSVNARQFGPEWTKAADGFHKVIEVTAVTRKYGIAYYSLKLDQDSLEISQSEEYAGFSLMWIRRGNGLQMRITDKYAQPVVITPLKIGDVCVARKGDGTPASHTISVPKVRYLDLNGDGIFDLLVDGRLNRNGRLFIVHHNQWIHVEGFGRGLGTNFRDARSHDGTRYIFDKTDWRVAKFREAVDLERASEKRDVAQELGPEWVKGKDPVTGLPDTYLKKVKVPIVHNGRDAAKYTLQMERDQLTIGELDDNRGFYVSWQKDGRVDVRRKADGTPAWHAVRFPKARYLDLNGDGIFDLFVDYRENAAGQLSILLDNRFTPVKSPGKGVSEMLREAISADGATYRFVEDMWQVNG